MNDNAHSQDLMMMDPYIVKDTQLDYDYPNPFFISNEGSNLLYTKYRDITKDHKHVYILCLQDDFLNDDQHLDNINLLYDKNTSIESLGICRRLVTLIEAPIDLLKIASFRPIISSIAKSEANIFNHNGYQLPDRILVSLMLSVRESTIVNWLQIYKKQVSLQELTQKKIFTSYYQIHDSYVEIELIDSIWKIEDSNYWQKDHNRKLSMEEIFQNRKFNLSYGDKWDMQETIKTKPENVMKYIKKFFDSTISSNQETYPLELTGTDILGPAVIPKCKNTKIKFYQVPDATNIDTNCVAEILVSQCFNTKEKYHLLCSMLSNRKYCHLVINNANVLKCNNALMKKFKAGIKYALSYAILNMYLDEYALKTRISDTNRIVFDISSASLLPAYPFSASVPSSNPYFCSLFGKQTSKSFSFGGVLTDSTPMSIVDLTEFRRRLNIFTTGNEDKDLFAGANWDRMAITGGIMAAICPTYNPLMKKFGGDCSSLTLFNFYKEYYKNSDIDIACRYDNLIDFINNVNHLQGVLAKNLKVKRDNISVSANKNLYIVINSKILQEKCEKGEIPFNYKYMLDNKNKKEVKFFFYETYVDSKKVSNRINIKLLGERINDNIFFHLVDYCDIEKTIIIIPEYDINTELKGGQNIGAETMFMIDSNYNYLDIGDCNRDTVYMKFIETVKYKLSSPRMMHPIEMFRIGNGDYFSCISRFHLPCVRSYYDGKTCKMLPSAIIAYQTLTNIEFKYFGGMHNPVIILSKYRNRGYTTLINESESMLCYSYISKTRDMREMYHIKTDRDIKRLLSCLSYTNPFFNTSHKSKSSKTSTIDEIDSSDKYWSLVKKDIPTVPEEILRLSCIDTNGNVLPFKNWVIDACYDMQND